MTDTDKKPCGIPAKTLPPCDLEWGHEGQTHSNGGDEFSAPQYQTTHRVRQIQRKSKGK